jgi:hypothetical protein
MEVEKGDEWWRRIKREKDIWFLEDYKKEE